jgi:hypothetical protein
MPSDAMTTCDPGKTPSEKCRQSVWVVCVVFIVALVVIKWHETLPLRSGARRSINLPQLVTIDSESYLAMAKEGPSQITSPFSKRILYPWLAGALSRVTRQPIPAMFLTLNLTALLALAFCLAEILRMTVGKPFLALLFLLTPFPLESFELAYLPDLFHMALTAAFFLLLLRQEARSALVILLLAFLTRENTLVLCLFTIGLAWFRARKRLCVGVGGVLCAGLAASAYFCRLGKPNMHRLPDFLYLLGKMPYYLLLNFSGFRIWSDVRPEQGRPFVIWHLPSWLKIGTDSVIGIASPDWRYPVSTAIVWLTVFGLGPLIIFYLIRRMGKTGTLPFAIELALIYGVASFLMGPLLGDWVDRLVGYGWPAFWIAMPYLFHARGLPVKTFQATLLAAGYLIVCWWPRLFGYGNNRSTNPWPCFGVLFVYLIAGFVLGRLMTIPQTPGKPAEPGPGRLD